MEEMKEIMNMTSVLNGSKDPTVNTECVSDISLQSSATSYPYVNEKKKNLKPNANVGLWSNVVMVVLITIRCKSPRIHTNIQKCVICVLS